MSDIHLSDKPPTARAEQTEDQWQAVMMDVLEELRQECEFAGIPLIIAGDLFDVPNPSVGLVRMAYEELPNTVYVVAGQHDLPNHSMGQMYASGLGLLQAVGKVTLLNWRPTDISGLQVYGFSWKADLTRPDSRVKGTNVAVIHRYCWKEGHSFPGCPKEDHVEEQVEKLKDIGFASACWGDNHKRFTHSSLQYDWWVNCGVAIPRNSDFKDYVPQYYYLLSDGTFEPQDFKTLHTWQPWVDEEKTEEASQKLLDFTKEVSKLVGASTKENFLDELQEAMGDLKDEAVRQKVWEVLQLAEEALK